MNAQDTLVKPITVQITIFQYPTQYIMKLTLILSIGLLLSFTNNVTVETYDWSVYEKADKNVNDAMNKVVEGHLIINDNLDLDIKSLPKKTKSQLAILNDAAYLEWLVAEEKLGKTEAAKYWEKNDYKGKLECYGQYDLNYQAYNLTKYDAIKSCEEPTRTACHLTSLQEQANIQLSFQSCMQDKYGDSVSPLKPLPTIK